MSGAAERPPVDAPADANHGSRPVGRWRAAIVPVGAAVLLIASGAIVFGEPWGLACLIAAGVCLVIAALAWWRRSAFTGIYATLLIVACLIVAIGVILESAAAWTTGLLAAFLISAAMPIAWEIRHLAREAAGALEHQGERSSRMERVLEKIHERSMLSDGAKRIIFRPQELDLLRGTIEQDIQQGDYDAAMLLCDDLAERFGYPHEAERLRNRVREGRGAKYDAQIEAALQQFDALLRQRNWRRVHEEEARLRRLFRNSAIGPDLRQRIERAREQHKHELERAFLEFAQREDVEGAMEIMRELDAYLTPNEAESLMEVAQGVVVRHRENLGVQFRLAVQDRRWAEAHEIGQTIVEEFPNTRMAAEVRTLQDELRQRADRPHQRTA